MSKTIVIKLTKAGNRTSTFSIQDDRGHVLASDVSKATLISGLAVSIEDSVKAVILSTLGCCAKTINIPVTTATVEDLAAMRFQEVNTPSLWRHLTDPVTYNKYYGCTRPYIIEYP